MHVIKILLFVITFNVCHGNALKENITRLQVDLTLFNQAILAFLPEGWKPSSLLFTKLLYDEKSALYEVNNVVENEKYEVRVSYPAVIPTDFVLEVFETHQHRKILNVEQLQFRALSKNYIVKVTAFRTGVPVDIKRLSDPVPYNIIVNRLYYGLSWETWKMIFVCFVTFILLIMFAVPYFMNLFQAIINDDVKKSY